MPYGMVLNREQLINWLADKAGDQQIQIREIGDVAVGPGQCLLLRDNPSEQDTRSGWIMAVQPRELRDFLAFAATYATSFSPFTAFFRVLSLPELDRHLGSPQKPARVPLELVGIPIAEAFVALQGRAQRLEDVSLSSIGGTLSWTFLEGLSAGNFGTPPSEIADRWLAARRLLTDADPNGANLTPTIEVWRVVFAQFGLQPLKPRDQTEKLAIDAYGRAVAAGGVDEQLWRSLSIGAPTISDAFSQMRGPREDRTRALSKLLNVLNDEKGLAPHYRGCLAGALMALLAEGSFRYLPLAASSPLELPGLPIWFALWSATFRSTDIFVAGDCLGRHLAKKLPSFYEPFAPPVDDIALEELALKEPKEISDLRTAQQSTISIEIAPYVSARFRRQTSVRVEQSSDANQAFAADISELQLLARRLDALAQKLGGPPEAKDRRSSSTAAYRTGRKSRT